MFDSFEKRGSFEKPIQIDDEGDQENSPPTNPVSERPNPLPCCEVKHLEQELKLFLANFIEKMFQKVLLSMFFDEKSLS